MTPEYVSWRDAMLAHHQRAHTTIRRDDAGNIVCFEHRNAEGLVCSETAFLHTHGGNDVGNGDNDVTTERPRTELENRVTTAVMMADIDVTSGTRPIATDEQYRAIADKLIRLVIGPERIRAAALGLIDEDDVTANWGTKEQLP